MSSIPKNPLALPEQSDAFPTDQDKSDAIQRRVHIWRKSLLKGEAFVHDRSDDTLALDSIAELGRALRLGKPSSETVTLLREFIESIACKSEESRNLWDEESTLAHRVLGNQRNGRPSNELAKAHAIVTFEIERIEKGNSQTDAIRSAYDAYMKAIRPSKCYEQDRQRKSSVTRNGDMAETNEADKFIETTIKPILRNAGLLPKLQPGRPKKSG